MLTMCSSHAYQLFFTCLTHVYHMFTTCLRNIHHVFYIMFTACSYNFMPIRTVFCSHFTLAVDQVLTFAPLSEQCPHISPHIHSQCLDCFSLPAVLVPRTISLRPLLLLVLSTPLSQIYFTTALTLYVSLPARCLGRMVRATRNSAHAS